MTETTLLKEAGSNETGWCMSAFALALSSLH